MTFYDPEDYKKNWSGYLGEFAFTKRFGCDVLGKQYISERRLCGLLPI